MKDVIQITKDLIKLPSFEREAAVGDYIIEYLKQFPDFEVEKQEIAEGRFNVIATTPGAPRLLLAGHMDTVAPKQGWDYDQYEPTVVDDRLYGLGSSDMKSGIAVILAALQTAKDPSGLRLLFYCDEEYNFAGMRKYLERAKTEPKPELALVGENSNLKIWNTHRGLIEVSFGVAGRTGHAANQSAGVNAIVGLGKVIADLTTWLADFADENLGVPSLNVAYARGGLNRGQDDNGVILGKDGNNIADYAETILDIRPTKKDLRAGTVQAQIERLIKKHGLTLINFDTKHDFGSLYTPPSDLKRVEAIVGAQYVDASSKGYGDGQLIQEALGIPVANLGAIGDQQHAPNEWVSVSSLPRLASMYAQIIEEYCHTD